MNTQTRPQGFLTVPEELPIVHHSQNLKFCQTETKSYTTAVFAAVGCALCANGGDR